MIVYLNCLFIKIVYLISWGKARKKYSGIKYKMNTFMSPLTLEEESKVLAKLKDNDEAARETLILHNMRLVAHVIKKYSVSEEDRDELLSIGTIGLIKAASTFNPDFGNKFATYAIRCIDNEILMYFRGRKKTKGDVSLYEPIGVDKEGNQIHLMDVLDVEDEDVIDKIIKKAQLKKVSDGIEDTLSERELLIIRLRYGLNDTKAYTQKEIAKSLGISRSYVSRIEKKALEKLKKLLI